MDEKKHKREDKFKTHRLLQIDKKIRMGDFPSVESLVAEYGVSRRTILRDVEFLRDRYNAPVEYDKIKKGYFYSDPTFLIQNVLLTEGDLFTVSTVLPLLEQYKNTPLEGSFRNIMSKIVDFLPEQVSVDTSFLNKDILFISDPLPKIKEKVFNAIFRAVKIRTVLSFCYKSAGSPDFKQKIFDPYHVICQKGNWYVIGFDHKSSDIRIYALSRIKDIAETGEHFEIPADFSLSKHIDPSFGIWNNPEQPEEYELLFAPSLVNYITEREWHKDQQVRTNEDGSVTLIFKTNQKQQARSWVMGFGTAVRVVRPEWLSEAIAVEAARVLEMYGK